MLKSTDPSLCNEWTFLGGIRFLDQEESTADDKIGICSFPRSGNSFLRRLMETCSGIATGSSISLHTATGLQVQGLMGEGIQDNRVWGVKGHHPAQQPNVTPFTSKKIVCIVRNPIDTFISFASLCNTLSHTSKPDFNYHEQDPNWWDWWVRQNAEKHAKYIQTLIQHSCVEKKNPIYFVRYEDLVSNKEQELTNLFRFMLDAESLEGTNIQRRIKQVV